MSDDRREIYWQLTASERELVYEMEKRRIRDSGELFSRKTRNIIIICVSVYLFGCILIYFGIISSAIEYWTTGRWVYKPEKTLLQSLVNSLIELARPVIVTFGAVVVCVWGILIPLAIPLLIWGWVTDFLRWKRAQ